MAEPEEPFYEPPRARLSAALELEPGDLSCARWQRFNETQTSGRPDAIAEVLQQEFLKFGFEEIRVDPLTVSPLPATNQRSTAPTERYHVTASVRGSTRDTLLMISLAPPSDAGNTAALTAVARYWSQRHHPDQPPALTVRFAVLPTAPGVEPEQLVTSYLAQRPRIVAQTVAVIALDPQAGAGISTNEPAFRPFLDEVGTATGTEIRTASNSAAVESPLATALVELDLPSIWINSIGVQANRACDQTTNAAMLSAGRLLLEIIERASRALAKPETQDGISLAG